MTNYQQLFLARLCKGPIQVPRGRGKRRAAFMQMCMVGDLRQMGFTISKASNSAKQTACYFLEEDRYNGLTCS